MRPVLLGLVVLAAVVLQTAVLAPLGLPVVVPDLTLVVVVAVALVAGADTGAVVGFAAGLAVALVPPSDALVGLDALIYTLVGYGVGWLLGGHILRLPEVATVTACAVAAASVVESLLQSLLSQSPGLVSALASTTAQALYSAVLAIVVIPLIAVVLRIAPGRA